MAFDTSRRKNSLIIDVSNLVFQWQAESQPILSINALQISQGETIFIRGPSGSGKSTLLSLLSGIALPNSGTVKVLGQALEKLSCAERDNFRANHIGYIFQMFNLIPYLSVIDNIILPCRFSEKRRRKALQRSATLELEAKRLLKNLDMESVELHKCTTNKLSIGQQQRVAAARALIGSPEIIIADEPTSSLDRNRCNSFIRLIFDEIRQYKATLIFVSHDERLHSSFDRTIDLDAINCATEKA